MYPCLFLDTCEKLESDFFVSELGARDTRIWGKKYINVYFFYFLIDYPKARSLARFTVRYVKGTCLIIRNDECM